jgi:hypothetical protein
MFAHRHKLHCTKAAVRKRREALGIAPFQKKHKVNWSIWDKYLGQNSDQELADKIGCDQTSVTYRREQLKIPPYRKIYWEQWDKYVGVESDTVLANRIGCSIAAVFHRRMKLFGEN